MIPAPGPSILFEFFGASQRVRALLANAMAGSSLRPDEYAVYSILVDRGSSSPTVMAHAVGMPPTTMSHYVRAMARLGHVERRPNPRDHRSALLSLTPAGRAAHASAAAAFDEANRRFLAALDVADASARRVLRDISRAAEVATGQLASDTQAQTA